MFRPIFAPWGQRLVCAFLLIILAFPAVAMPPEGSTAAPAPAPVQAASEGTAPGPGATLELPPAEPEGDPPPVSEGRTLRASGRWRLSGLLLRGLLAGLAMTAGLVELPVEQALAQGLVGLPPTSPFNPMSQLSSFGFTTPPATGPLGLNLSDPNPPNLLAAQSLTLALMHGNASGALPPMDQLTEFMTQASPSGAPYLSTLPALLDVARPGNPSLSFGSDSPSVGDEVASNGGGGLSPAHRLRDQLVAIQSTMTAAQLSEAYFIQAAIGFQIMADALFIPPSANTTSIINILLGVGNELLASAHLTGAVSAQVQVNAAQYALDDLESGDVPGGGGLSTGGSSTSGASSGPPAEVPLGLQLLDGAMDVDVVYGSWQRWTPQGSDETVVYRLTPTAITRVTQAPAAQGGALIRTERYQGQVVGELAYDIPPGASGPASINVTLSVSRPGQEDLVLPFFYFNITLAGEEPGSLEVLVERNPGRRLYFRLN